MKKKQGAVRILAIAGLVFLTIYILIMLSGFRGTRREGLITENEYANGYNLFAGLLKNLGYNIQYWDSYSPPNGKGVLILFHDELDKSMDQKKILNWAAEGNVVFVIGPKEDVPIFNATIQTGEKAVLDIHQDYEQDIPEGIFYVTDKYWKYSQSKRYEGLLKNDSGHVLARYQVKNGRVYLLSDKSLFANSNLTSPDIAILLNNILKEYYNEPLYILANPPEVISVPSPVMILLQGDLFFITIHLLLMLVAFYFWQGKSFGPGVRLVVKNRRTITEHLEAVGQFYRRSENPGLEDSIDRQYFIQNIHMIMGITRNLPIEKLAAKVALYVDESEHELLALITDCEHISDKEIISRHKQRNAILKKLSNRGRSKNGQSY